MADITILEMANHMSKFRFAQIYGLVIYIEYESRIRASKIESTFSHYELVMEIIKNIHNSIVCLMFPFIAKSKATESTLLKDTPISFLHHHLSSSYTINK